MSTILAMSTGTESHLLVDSAYTDGNMVRVYSDGLGEKVRLGPGTPPQWAIGQVGAAVVGHLTDELGKALGERGGHTPLTADELHSELARWWGGMPSCITDQVGPKDGLDAFGLLYATPTGVWDIRTSLEASRGAVGEVMAVGSGAAYALAAANGIGRLRLGKTNGGGTPKQIPIDPSSLLHLCGSVAAEFDPYTRGPFHHVVVGGGVD